MTDSTKETRTPLIVEKDDAVTTITINDAPWNRMSLEFMNELEVLVENIAGDKSVRAVVVTGAGQGIIAFRQFSTQGIRDVIDFDAAFPRAGRLSAYASPAPFTVTVAGLT